MDGVEIVEQRVKRRHSLTSIELVGHGALGERRHVQSCASSLLVEVVGEADVPACHTHRIHTGVLALPRSVNGPADDSGERSSGRSRSSADYSLATVLRR